MTSVETHEHHEEPHLAADEAAHHPTDRKYVEIALILAAITAAEVATYFVDLGNVAAPLLIVMMVVKFAMVAAWFMHLRFDSRLFRRLFVAGIITAVAVYIAALTMFEFWTEEDHIDENTGGGETVGMVHVQR